MFPFSFLGGGDEFQGLLDLYPNAAAAYSLRKLRADYSGAAVRIRRSGDNSEFDFGFDVNGDFDIAAAQTFCIAGGGTRDGFITTRYDQSGNGNNATQTTAAQQIKCVDNGVFYIQNGKPCLYANNNSKAQMQTPLTLQNNYSVFAVAIPTDYNMLFGAGPISGLSYFWTGGFTPSNFALIQRSTSNTFNSTISNPINNQYLFESLNNANSLEIYANNVLNISATDSEGFYLGALETGFSFSDLYRFNGYIFEYIIYQNVPNNNGIKNNINSYYGIY